MLCALTTCIVLWEGTACGVFPWDDAELMKQVASIAEGRASVWDVVLGNFQPLTMASLWIDQVIGHGDIATFHRTNLFLHGANVLLVFLLARRILGGVAPAVFVALLFGLHPIQVESVAWIAERKTLLYTFFFLLACLRYLRYLRTGKKLLLAEVAVLFVLSLCAKSQGVALPLFLFGLPVLQHGWAKWRSRAYALLPLLAIGVLFSVLTIFTQATDGYVHLDRGGSLSEQLVAPLIAFGQYPVRILFPFSLSVFHPLPNTLVSPDVLIGIGVTLGLVGLLFFALRAGHHVFPALVLMYTATVLPVLQLVPFGSALTADRYAYLATFPVLIGLVHGVVHWTQASRYVLYGASLAGASIVLVFAHLSRERTVLWCDPLALFEQAAARYPDSEVLAFNVGNHYLKAGRLEEAERLFTHALSIDPNTTEALIGSAQTALAQDRPEQAIDRATRMLQLAPDHPSAYMALFTRAMGFKASKRPHEALADLKRVLLLKPDHGAARYQQGVCQAMLGQHGQALASYTMARRMGVNEEDLALNMAISYGWSGNYPSAIAELNTVLARSPKSAEGLFLLGIAKQRTGANGCPDLQQAVSLGHVRAREALAAFCAGPAPADTTSRHR